jgi:formyltetrahydrofolate-dependent phosphoribosylglycinamide formyltransferase
MTARLAVLVSGNGTNLQAILDACASGRLDAEVVVVLSNRKAAYGLERAALAGIPTEYLPLRPFLDTGRSRRDYDAELAAVLASHRPDWVVLAGWMHLLSAPFLDNFPSRVVNLHPALPGAFPGADAISEAWEAHLAGKLDSTGVMVHLVPDDGVDNGPVVGTVEVPIVANDSRETLEARIHAAEHQLLVDCLSRLIDLDPRRKQPYDGRTGVHHPTDATERRTAALPEASQ